MTEPALRHRDINWRHEGVQGSTMRPVVNAHLRSVCDTSDRENLKDAKHQLDRCVTDADFAAWARRWGESFVTYALHRKT